MSASRLSLGLAWSAFIGSAVLAAERDLEPAAPLAVSGPTIELPPMIVAENTATWLYVRVGSDEYLSRCSATTTVDFILARERLLQRLRTMVPTNFLSDLPSITLLSDQAQNPKVDDQVAREILRAPKELRVPPARWVRFLPNLGIDGRDFSALFTFLGEQTLHDTKLVVTNGYLRFRLERRTPMLPPWLVEGILANHARLSLAEDSLTLKPMTWLSAGESRALPRDPLRPRALLPAAEMFAPNALQGEGNQHPRRAQTLRLQVELFVRWALDPRNQVREAFWKFAARSGEERVTEELFTQCFGFGFSDLRDQLNDYLPIALKAPLELGNAPEQRVMMNRPSPASRRDNLRIRGEWERLEIAYVQRSHPNVAGQYIEQARRTLRRAYDEGDRDPRLLSDLGLCEIDAGNAKAGIPLLEQAIAAGVTRPRAYFEVARFRFAQLLRDQPAERIFSAGDVAPVLEPLRQALTLTPPLPEIFGLLADVSVRYREPIPPGDATALLEGARCFGKNPPIAYRVAFALARAGRRLEAIALLKDAADYEVNPVERARFTELQTALSRGQASVP